MNFILCGFKKCGKSYYGKLLADRLKLPFIDTDRLIEKKLGGLTCSQIVHAYGEPKFRVFESEVIDSLVQVKNTVIALGGGSLQSEQNRERIVRFGKLIYLSLEKETLKKRILQAPSTALFSGDLEDTLEKMIEERCPIYEKLCHIKITLDGLSEDEILNKLEACCKSRVAF